MRYRCVRSIGGSPAVPPPASRSRHMNAWSPSRRVWSSLWDRRPRPGKGRPAARHGSSQPPSWLSVPYPASRRGVIAAQGGRAPGSPPGQPAHQPLGLDRVPGPWLGPAVRDAGRDRLLGNLAAIAIEQWQLSTGLVETALEIAPLRRGRPHGCLIGVFMVARRRSGIAQVGATTRGFPISRAGLMAVTR